MTIIQLQSSHKFKRTHKPLKFCCEVFNKQIVDDVTAEIRSSDVGTDLIHAAIDRHDGDVCSLAADTQHQHVTVYTPQTRHHSDTQVLLLTFTHK